MIFFRYHDEVIDIEGRHEICRMHNMEALPTQEENQTRVMDIIQKKVLLTVERRILRRFEEQEMKCQCNNSL